jgi:precorrin-6B methylase 2
VELAAIMLEAAREVVGDAALAPAALHRAIADRSVRYTSDRAHLARPADPVGDLAARAVFFTPADEPKLGVPLGELARRGALPSREPLRVVDLGAGCGAMSLGIAARIATPLELHLVDRDADALAIARRALSRAAPHARVTTAAGDAATIAIPPAELVVLGNVLNELPAAARLPLISRALAAIADDGAVIAIEPALRETTRALHELRDAVLAARLGHVFAPCTRSCAPCPALADPSDWCHEDRAHQLPPVLAELARVTHLRDDGLKFSYLVLRRSSTPLVDEAGAAWRVVSAAHAQKGKLELYGCSDAGRVTLRLLRRNRADANRAFERAARGDVLVVRGAESSDARVEITADTSVEKR